MHRRHLLKGASAIPVLAGLPGLARAGVRVGASRVRPTDPSWPTPADWEALNRRVGGSLVKPVSMLAPCEEAPKSPACSALLKQLRNPYFIGDQPSGTQVSGWLNAWTPASSAYAVAARDAADVVAAVNFARAHNLRVVVKGGGHSYQGTSNGADSLLIWTRAMRDVTLHDDFVAKGCRRGQAATPAVTIAAGAVWMDAYDAVTTKAGRYVQGGGCTTVGVAGHIQSGGFGSYSKRFGTAAGSLLEAEVVTADGVVRIVNPCQHSDLFWAIKGGGGGSLGVVTRVTVRTHELPALFGGAGAKIKAASDAAFQRLVRRFVEFYAMSLFNPNWGEQVSVRPDNTLEVSMVNQGLDTVGATQVWRPFLDWVAASPGDFTMAEAFSVGSGPARAWWDVEARRKRGSTALISDSRPGAPPSHAWWDGDQEQVGAFLHGYDSVWLPATLLQVSERDRLAKALFTASRSMAVQLHFNKGLAGGPPEMIADARNTAMNPDALNAFALAIVATGGPPSYYSFVGFPTDLAHARKDAANVDKAAAALRQVAPRAGSYVSESNYFNQSWRDAFWGHNYPRLRGVKAKYDRDGLFVVHHGVGSEDWSADGFSRVA